MKNFKNYCQFIFIPIIVASCFSQNDSKQSSSAPPAQMQKARSLPYGHPPITGKSHSQMIRPGHIKPGKSGKIADIYMNSKQLNGAMIEVRGEVVKFSKNIMKKNWLHLQDGSGDAKKGNHDLTVTMLDSVTVGDIVTIKGKLGTDKNLGAGYSYKVIIEDAKVIK